MNTYLMFGNYSAQAINSISGDRTQKAVELLQKCGGEMREMYACLGGNCDLCFIVDMPGIEEAMQASIKLTQLTGIQFQSCPAVAIERFDRLCK